RAGRRQRGGARGLGAAGGLIAVGFLDKIRSLGGGGDDDPGKVPEDERERRVEQDIARIESGSIPLAAEERLRALGAGAMGFTSGLSGADSARTQLERIRPVCQVMGTSVYKVGWQNYPWTSGWGSDAVLTELDRLT